MRIKSSGEVSPSELNIVEVCRFDTKNLKSVACLVSLMNRNKCCGLLSSIPSQIETSPCLICNLVWWLTGWLLDL